MKINPNLLYESGSNTNGNYIKYTDGTMICWNKVKSGTITFPKTFTSAPTIVASCANSQNNFMHVVQAASNNGTQATLVATFQSIGTTNAWALDTSVDINYIAIGKWE